MSLYDDFRALGATLLEDTFGVPATLYTVVSEFDRANDRRIKHEVETPCFAVMTPRKVKADNGAILVETVARVSSATNIGDRLVVGNCTYKVTRVEVVAPDGGDPIFWMAVVTR